MKIDPQGQAFLRTTLLAAYADEPVRAAIFDEDGETVTLQLPKKVRRFRLTPLAQRILHGEESCSTTDEPLFTPVEK
jgi:hypothetical protein